MDAQIRTARGIDRSRYGDDIEVGRGQRRRIAAIEQRRMRQVRCLDFARAIDA